MTKSANTDNHLTGRHDKQETIWCYKFVLLSHDKVTWCRTQRFDCFLKKTCSKHSKRCVLHQVTLWWDNRTNLWYHPTTTMNNNLFHNKKRFVTNKTEKSPSLEILQQHRVNAKSKSLPPNRCSTHHVLNFLDKNVCLPAFCPDRRYTHRSGRSGLWRCWNENRNITSQVNTRANLTLLVKKISCLSKVKTLYFYSIRSTEWNPDAYEEAKIDIWYIFWIRFRKDGGENNGGVKFHMRIDQGLSLSY